MTATRPCPHCDGTGDGRWYAPTLDEIAEIAVENACVECGGTGRRPIAECGHVDCDDQECANG